MRIHEELPRELTDPDGARFVVDSEDVFSPLAGMTSRMMGAVVTPRARDCAMLIDVGCGLGYLGIKAAVAGVGQVVLLDIHLPAIETSTRRYHQT